MKDNVNLRIDWKEYNLIYDDVKRPDSVTNLLLKLEDLIYEYTRLEQLNTYNKNITSELNSIKSLIEQNALEMFYQYEKLKRLEKN